MEMPKLTPKQRAFVEEYLIDLNATASAKRAGYSQRTAYSIGEENLRKPEIQKAIAEAQKARAERVKLTQDYVINDLMEIVERCMEREAFNAIGAIRALELLGKHLGMFRERVEMGVSITPAEILAAVREDRERNEVLSDKQDMEIEQQEPVVFRWMGEEATANA